MTRNHTCSICDQPFNSERDLQEHQRNDHSPSEREKPLPESDQSGNDRVGQDEPRRERIA